MNRPKHKSRSIEFSLRKRFLFLSRNSGIHGLGHLVRDNASFFARLFWLLVLLASVGCLYLLLMHAVEREAEVGYTVDTRYLPWKTTFPSITVCESYSRKQTQTKLLELYPDILGSQPFVFQRYVADLTFNRAYNCRKDVCVPCGDQMIPCDLNWRRLIEQVRKNCSDIMTKCSIRGKEFPCCEKFKKVDSEIGSCFSFNTLQTEGATMDSLFYVNRTTGPAVVSFRVLTDARIALHSNEELYTNFLDEKQWFDVIPYKENQVEYTFSVVEFANDPRLFYDTVEVRGCRHLHEIPKEPFDTYLVYSYGACRLADSTQERYQKCGCVHPIRDLSYKNKYCNFTGLNCLVEIGVEEPVKLVDPCLPSCLESELNMIHLSSRKIESDTAPGTEVKINMVSLPSLRYERNLLHNQLDLVVSVGGLVGLFFAASILSLVEIFYLLLRAK